MSIYSPTSQLTWTAGGDPITRKLCVKDGKLRLVTATALGCPFIGTDGKIRYTATTPCNLFNSLRAGMYGIKPSYLSWLGDTWLLSYANSYQKCYGEVYRCEDAGDGNWYLMGLSELGLDQIEIERGYYEETCWIWRSRVRYQVLHMLNTAYGSWKSTLYCYNPFTGDIEYGLPVFDAYGGLDYQCVHVTGPGTGYHHDNANYNYYYDGWYFSNTEYSGHPDNYYFRSVIPDTPVSLLSSYECYAQLDVEYDVAQVGDRSKSCPKPNQPYPYDMSGNYCYWIRLKVGNEIKKDWYQVPFCTNPY